MRTRKGRGAMKLEGSGPCIVGIDEAGRGPVLGPMVYGAAVCLVKDEGRLRALGCDDSKAMTEADRESVRDRLKDSGLVESFLTVLDAEDIGRKMLRRTPYNLNAISHDTAADLVRRIMEAGGQVDQLYVDTVGIPEKYEAWLRRLFPGIPTITVAKKADSTYPIVGAASIFAKTVRDETLRSWDCEDLDANLKGNYGSGYPGDPSTVAWLEKAFDPHFGFPSLVRFSWSTARTMIEAKGISVEFPDPDEESDEENHQDIRNHFKRRKTTPAVPKFYSSRHLSDEITYF